MANITIVTFYKFTCLNDLQSLRLELLHFCQDNKIFGTIILATEGINGTLAGSPRSIELVVNLLQSKISFKDLECKYSSAIVPPFQKLKLKIKQEIVTLGKPEVLPHHKAGTAVTADEWDALISKPEVLVIDTRNQYEIEFGSFKKAINPNTNHFREFPKFAATKLDPKKHKKIAMFCTGGIRCEKASSYLLAQGFEEVYQLKGGIIKYLEEKNIKNSNLNEVDTESISSNANHLWEGNCFVFDERIFWSKNTSND